MWRNWAGDQQCAPVATEWPSSVGELRRAVQGATGSGRQLKVAASGHSFTDIACTDGVMLRLERMCRVLDVDPAGRLVKVEAGIGLGHLSEELDRHGLALENLGDIDRQTLAGA